MREREEGSEKEEGERASTSSRRRFGFCNNQISHHHRLFAQFTYVSYSFQESNDGRLGHLLPLVPVRGADGRRGGSGRGYSAQDNGYEGVITIITIISIRNKFHNYTTSNSTYFYVSTTIGGLLRELNVQWIRKTKPTMNRDEGGYRLSHVWDSLLATPPSEQYPLNIQFLKKTADGG